MSKPALTRQVTDDFVDLTSQQVRGLLHGEKSEELLSDKNIDLFYAALVVLKKDVEVQLSNLKSRLIQKRVELNKKKDDGTEYLQYKAQEADWRAKAIKFLSVVEGYIAKTKARKSQIARNTEATQDLVEAILQQKEEIGEDEASVVDKQVWSLVQELIAD